MEFIQSNLFSNAVAFLALALSTYSIFYTRSQNKFSFVISGLDIYYENNSVELNFVVANNSTRTHVLEKIIFLDKNNHVLLPIDSNDWYNPLNFELLIGQLEKPELMLPNATLEFSYNFESVPAFIKIVSNQRINKFKKYKLVSTDSYEHN
ncbi:hypothetical protein V060_02636 [Staphylococcus aureus R0294]|uniref:hypothetical protein n=1 Tax=Staphylococcus aureus TaxID=1280 RepID=UPI00044F017D|nr:hypothetical protein [Staphylococcus aureus]EZY60321.1 hypothetical protein V060_02636 [Staphylococcus aureus R0294]